jgi:hypothetical protein
MAFSKASPVSLEITPIGAAIVEAMPNRERMKRIQYRFDRNNECPVSEIFTKEQVEHFYKQRGKAVRIVDAVEQFFIRDSVVENGSLVETETERQWWSCETCNISGVIAYESHAGAWLVIQKLDDDHQRVSPECTATVKELRLTPPLTQQSSELSK